MNDLTKEARRRALEEAAMWQQLYRPMDLTGYRGYSAGLSQSNIDQSYGRPKYGNDYLEPDRPLTGKPGDYLTKWDEGSECFTLEAWPMSLFKHQLPNKPVDVDEFRKFCEEIGE